MHNSFILGHTKFNISLKTLEYSFLLIWWINDNTTKFAMLFLFKEGFRNQTHLWRGHLWIDISNHICFVGLEYLKKCCKSLLNLWLDGNFENVNWQPGRTCLCRHFAQLTSRLTLLGSEEGLRRSIHESYNCITSSIMIIIVAESWQNVINNNFILFP